MTVKTWLLAALAFNPFILARAEVIAHDLYARASPPNAPTSAVFGDFINNSDKQRVIVSAATAIADRVELHQVIMDGDVLKMRPVDKIAIPANNSLTLKPGGLHIMLVGVVQTLTAGDTIPMTLMFANGERQIIRVPVKHITNGKGHQHHH